jgi:hypothetical protein
MVFCLGTPNGSPEIPIVRIPMTLEVHNLTCRPSLQWGLKKSCIPCWKLSNGVLHIACTQGNWVDSWHLVVESQTANLTPGLSFGHNLCFRYPNGQCEPILNIYASIAFQSYKKKFKEMSFEPWNCALKIRKSIWDSNSQHRSSLGSVKVHSLTFTLFALPGTCEVTPRSPSWHTTLLALVASLRLGLRHSTSYLSFPFIWCGIVFTHKSIKDWTFDFSYYIVVFSLCVFLFPWGKNL